MGVGLDVEDLAMEVAPLHAVVIHEPNAADPGPHAQHCRVAAHRTAPGHSNRRGGESSLAGLPEVREKNLAGVAIVYLERHAPW